MSISPTAIPKAAAKAQAAMKAKGYATDFIEMDVTESRSRSTPPPSA